MLILNNPNIYKNKKENSKFSNIFVISSLKCTIQTNRFTKMNHFRMLPEKDITGEHVCAQKNVTVKL